MERPFSVLPKTIEGATRRYLTNYENNFVGSAADMYRLRDLAEDFIYRLRKVAPKFYEERLPQLVNQASSQLLTYNVSKEDELKKFHETHAYFLLVLQDLRHSQPAGEVNFQNERKRYEERTKLIKRQAQLEAAIDELEAVEFEFDELGEEEYDTKYEKVFSKLESLKRDQRDVNTKIAYIEGKEIEEKPNFELRVKPNSILNRLSKEQLKDLEDQMLEFYMMNNQKKTAIYMDKSIIDSMIERLDIDKSKFQIEELRHITKDALDAYKSYYREKEQKRREEFYEDLLGNQRLRPKEGIILDDPDCLPDHIKTRLDANLSKCRQETEELLESFSTRQDLETALDDQIDEDSGDEANKNNAEEIIIKLKAKGVEFARTKEAPRDDFMEQDEDDFGEEEEEDELEYDKDDEDEDEEFEEAEDIITIS